MIYLDNAATTFPKPQQVYDYVDWVQRNIAVNTGRGVYKVASDAMGVLEDAKNRLSRFLNASEKSSVIFTPSATIAANEIIGGLEWDRFKVVYVTPFEHNAIMRPLELFREKYGFKIIVIPFEKETQELNYEGMLSLFENNEPDYIFLNHVSNVTGLILPIETICSEAKKYGAITIVDGSQSIGTIPLQLKNIDIDLLIFAGHKNLYASWGIGGFINNTNIPLKPFITGGTGSDSLNLSNSSLEVGSPNIIAIGSLSKALEWIEETQIETIYKHKKTLSQQLIEGLRQLNTKLYLPSELDNHTSVISFNLSQYLPAEVGMILDQDYDIAVRTGFHCAPLIHKYLGTEEKQGTIRVSIGYFNSEEDINSLLKAISEL